VTHLKSTSRIVVVVVVGLVVVTAAAAAVVVVFIFLNSQVFKLRINARAFYGRPA